MVFGVPEVKDPEGSQAWAEEGIAQRGLRVLLEELEDDHVVIADLCLDEYTDHGHCGVLDDAGNVDNDRTLERYGRIAVAQASAACSSMAITLCALVGSGCPAATGAATG